MSDGERRGRNMERRFRKRDRSRLSPVISDSREAENISLPSFRDFCDYCMEPVKPGRRKMYGRVVTHLNADKLVHLRHLAESALKFFNDDKSTSFKLVKVCKINRPRPARYGLTFTAQEDGVKECLVFRGVVYKIRGSAEALFCEIKVPSPSICFIASSEEQVVKFRVDSENDWPDKEYICLYQQEDDDGEITLRRDDDDYIGSKRARESED